jgi:hypothetical protein
VGKPVQFATLDIETDPFDGQTVPKPFAVDFFDGTKHVTFWGSDCIEKVLPYVQGYTGIIFAHNGGKFDWFYFRRWIEGECLFIGSRLISAKIGKAEIRDSYALMPSSLKKLSTGKRDIEMAKLHRDSREKHKVEIVMYLRADTASLRKALERWIEEFGLHLTLASTGFSQLKSLGYQIPRFSEKMDEKFRPFYYGGRCESFAYGVFNHGTKPLRVYDINSAYPHAMQSARLWHGNDYELVLFGGPKEGDLLIIDAESRGFFPVRTEEGLWFPADGQRRRFLVTFWEFNSGLKAGMKRHRIEKIYRPLETINFSAFVEKFYSMKLEAEKNGDATRRLFAKLLLNSSYGKFAINPRNFHEHKFTRLDEELEADWELDEESIEQDLRLWKRPCKTLGRFLNVATAASVTGFVRSMLIDAIHAVRSSGGTVFYTDTDSLVTDAELPTSDDLGAWKLEMDGITQSAFAGKKLYALRNEKTGKEKLASKGVRANFDQIKSVALGHHVKFQFHAPSFSIKTGDSPFIARTIRATNHENSKT